MRVALALMAVLVAAPAAAGDARLTAEQAEAQLWLRSGYGAPSRDIAGGSTCFRLRYGAAVPAEWLDDPSKAPEVGPVELRRSHATKPAAAVPGTTRHEFALFSISVPTGWTHVANGPEDRHKGRYGFGGPGVRFEGPGGEYLDIAPDPAIDGPSADAWWKARPTFDGGINVQASDKLCVKQPPEPPDAQGVPGLSLPECLVGDGRLDIALSFNTRGHGYVVTYGNDRRERAEDMKPFQVILATFKAK